jgi:protein PhnA
MYNLNPICLPAYKNMYNTTMNTEENEEIVVKDAFGNILANGDSVVVVKDLKVKGTSSTLKKGTKIKNIHLTDDEELIECNADGMKGLVLRVEFLKKS